MTSDTDRQEDLSSPYWLVEVDTEKCSLCEVCARCCPSGAIRSEQAEDTLVILFSHELCDGCRDCLKRCPEDAMTLEGIEALSDGLKRRVLAEGEMLLCSVCGKHFAPVAKLEAALHRRGDNADIIREQCPLCRRTQMVARFIDEKREAHGRKAEYRTGRKWQWKPVADGDPDGPPCPEIPDSPSGQNVLTPKNSGEDSSAMS